jgi:catechol 2,3-dioxygenase-like lactoylglutathione lyase family enzyme
MTKTFDRRSQDVGNIVALEHVNVKIPDQVMATAFYVQGLGFTRDPYLMVGTENMWINLGQEQFHLPTGDPQVLRGQVGMVVPDLEALKARLESVKPKLAGTKFAFSAENKHVSVTCPWGNSLRCHAAGPEWGEVTLGMAYVEFPVAPGHADGIKRFYERVFDAPATVVPDHAGAAAHVRVGSRQELVFRETTKEIPRYDGHHIAVYIANFSRPHAYLAEHGLVTEESNDYQYRFQDIVDPDSRQVLFTIEHEVRSFTHPMLLRPMMNRNPSQRQATYQRGRDAFVPGMS